MTQLSRSFQSRVRSFLTLSVSLLSLGKLWPKHVLGLTTLSTMADPLSIVGAIIAVATTAIQTSKFLVELIEDIKGSPREVKSISRDAHAFYSIIFSLIATLKEERVRHIVSRDETVMELVRNLDKPLSNCQAELGDIMLKIQRQLILGFNANGSGMCFIKIKWAFFTKTELRASHLRLEANKSTLCAALNAFSMYAALHIVAGSSSDKD